VNFPNDTAEYTFKRFKIGNQTYRHATNYKLTIQNLIRKAAKNESFDRLLLESFHPGGDRTIFTANNWYGGALDSRYGAFKKWTLENLDPANPTNHAIAITKKSNNYVQIILLAVNPKSVGWGHMMLSAIGLYARANNLRYVYVESVPGAVGFYGSDYYEGLQDHRLNHQQEHNYQYLDEPERLFANGCVRMVKDVAGCYDHIVQAQVVDQIRRRITQQTNFNRVFRYQKKI